MLEVGKIYKYFDPYGPENGSLYMLSTDNFSYEKSNVITEIYNNNIFLVLETIRRNPYPNEQISKNIVYSNKIYLFNMNRTGYMFYTDTSLIGKQFSKFFTLI